MCTGCPCVPRGIACRGSSSRAVGGSRHLLASLHTTNTKLRHIRLTKSVQDANARSSRRTNAQRCSHLQAALRSSQSGRVFHGLSHTLTHAIKRPHTHAHALSRAAPQTHSHPPSYAHTHARIKKNLLLTSLSFSFCSPDLFSIFQLCFPSLFLLTVLAVAGRHSASCAPGRARAAGADSICCAPPDPCGLGGAPQQHTISARAPARLSR